MHVHNKHTYIKKIKLGLEMEKSKSVYIHTYMCF